MSPWRIERTEAFLRELHAFRKHHALLAALDKKLQRLQEDPLRVGGMLMASSTGSAPRACSAAFG